MVSCPSHIVQKKSSLESERFLGLENFKELNTFGLSKTDPDENARISKDENKIKEVKQKSRSHCKNFVQFFSSRQILLAGRNLFGSSGGLSLGLDDSRHFFSLPLSADVSTETLFQKSEASFILKTF